MICNETHSIDNGAGWQLALYQTWDASRLDPSRRPVLIVPGYGMNSYIFDFHPSGRSLVRSLAEAGFEVWRVDLRAQGGSRSAHRASHDLFAEDEQFSIADLAVTDIGAAIGAVASRTQCVAAKVDVLGASLGGSLILAHAVLVRDSALGSMVVMGSPVRWVAVHPLIKMAFASPMLVGMLRIRGTRKLSELALPQIVRFMPWLLRVYMNPQITDTRAARDLVRTVEDPNRFINQEIARWIKQRDLVINGVNISDGLASITSPLLCIAAKSDGIVPRPTAEFPYHAVGSKTRSLLVVGTDDLEVAHADMFISRAAETHVFRPIADWLARQNTSDSAP